METKIRIIEVSPKLIIFKNNPKDIISISFVSDNYNIKIEDIEKAISNNDLIILNLKESKDLKNKNIIQPIKISLILNNKNIIGTGEIIPIEGINWYQLDKINNNNTSKESLITSSTSNSNIKNNNNLVVGRRVHNISDSQNILDTELSKYNTNQLNTSTAITKIKIKFLINISNKKKALFTKISNINDHKNNRRSKEFCENYSKFDEIIFDSKKDIINAHDFNITESDISKLNNKNIITITSTKKNMNKKMLASGISKKFSKKKVIFNSNQNITSVTGNNMSGEGLTNSKIVSNTINNSKVLSPKKKIQNSKNIKFLNGDLRMKTSMGFKKIKNFESKEVISEKEEIHIKSEKRRKMNSCDNIEDAIIDQTFKNNLKNDEILKANFSRNNSFNNLTNNTNNNSLRVTKNRQSTYNNNGNYLFRSARSKIKGQHDRIGYSHIISQNNDQSNPLYINLKSLHSNYRYEKNCGEKNLEENIELTNADENFERLKNDFLLLYSNCNMNKISNDVLFLELQLMIEKILAIQERHQKEYIELFNDIIKNKKLFDNYEKEYILLNKKINKLHIKKMNNDIIDQKRELYHKNINNFIQKRKKIMDKEENIIWQKILEKANESQVITNNKNKMINIFLTICEKKENTLNKLSFKYYKDTKNKYFQNDTKNIIKKTNKLANSLCFSDKNISKYKKQIKENDIEPNLQCLRTNHNEIQNNINININPNKNKRKKISKKNTTKNIINRECCLNNNNNNINFDTMINDNLSHNNNFNTRKNNNHKNKAASIDKIPNKKKGINKSQ